MPGRKGHLVKGREGFPYFTHVADLKMKPSVLLNTRDHLNSIETSVYFDQTICSFLILSNERQVERKIHFRKKKKLHFLSQFFRIKRTTPNSFSFLLLKTM